MRVNIPAVFITVTLVFLSRELINAWQHSPFDRLGVIAFSIWIAGPILLRKLQSATQLWIHPIAAAIAAIGWVLGEFNFIIYIGLSLSLCGFVQVGRSQLICIFTSISWMPIFGYGLSIFSASPDHVLILRLALSIVGTVLLFCIKDKNP